MPNRPQSPLSLKQMQLGLTALFLSLHFQAGAQDYPTTGLVYGETESNSIQYDCKLRGQELKESEIPKKRAEAIAQLLSEERNSNQFKKSCDEMILLVSQIEAVIKKPQSQLTDLERRGMLRMTPAALEKTREFARLTSAHCKNPSQKTREALANHLTLRESKTCRVGGNMWKEVFVRAKGIEAGNFGGSDSWVTKDQPSGACGVVLVNRWELDKSEDTKKYKFWNYVARKVITNPAGAGLLGMKCSDLDEGTYLYSWRSNDINIDCETIKFSPF
jgi:hypothetical protein